MGFFDRFRPPPLGIGIPPRVADAAPVPFPVAYAGGGGSAPTYNLSTGQGTDRDPLEAEVLRYWFMLPDEAQLQTLLRRDGIAQRLCTMRPKWRTRKGPKAWRLSDKSPIAAPLAERMATLQVARRYRDGAIEANKFGNAATWIQLQEGGTYQPNRQGMPVDKRTVTGVHDLALLTKRELRPVAWQEHMGDPWIPLGAPLVFEVQKDGAAKFCIHASRLILWRGTPVPSGSYVPPSYGWGDDSILVSALTALQTMGYIRRSIDRASNAYQKLVAYATLPPVGTNETLRQKHAQAWAFLSQQSALGVFLAEKGTDKIPSDRIETLDAPLTGLLGLGSEGEKFLARATGIPPQVWSGEYTGGLGDMSGQIGAFLLDIEAEQVDVDEPAIRYLADLLYAAAGVYRPAFEVVFAPVVPSDPVKEAQARKTQLEGDQIGIDMGALSSGQVFRSRFQDGYQPELQPARPGEEPTGRAAQVVPGSAPGAARVPAADAADGIWIGLDVDAGSLPMAARALGPGLRPEPWPHVTLLFLGAVRPAAMAKVLGAASAAALRAPLEVLPVEVGELGADQAQVVFLRRGGLDSLQRGLLNACAPAITAEQFPRFLPHMTLGYGEADLSGLVLPDAIPVRALCVRRGDVEIARYKVG